MNQILIADKIYITPELRRKKKIYKLNFIISIILIVILFSVYVYAEFDRNKSEEVSQDILSGMQMGEQDDTTIAQDDNVWTIALDVDWNMTDDENVSSNESEKTASNQENNKLTGTYKAQNGKIYNMVGQINIPSINSNYPILSETTDALLKISVCKFWGCEPNEVGNLCIAGHNYRNTRFFSKVPGLTVGDKIEITDLSGRIIEYSVYDKFTVDPTDVSCTSQLTNGKKIVTLITCTNDSKQRVVVKAKEIQ